jgi:hypothetical protein
MLRTMVFFCLIAEIWGEMAAANDIFLLPFLALGFFCGIRPNGELQEIESRDIFSRGQGCHDSIGGVEDSYAKVCCAVGECRRVAKAVSHEISFHQDRPLLLQCPSWIHQGMRHTFCSCWLAKYEDVNKLLLMSGHSSPQMRLEELLPSSREV